jgi:hypothetical protein
VGYEASIDLGDLREAREIVLAFRHRRRRGKDRGIGRAPRGADPRSGGGLDGFLEGVPEFRAGDKLSNVCTHELVHPEGKRVHFDDPRFPYPFTSVNKHHYYNQFFWDSAYQAIAWLW